MWRLKLGRAGFSFRKKSNGKDKGWFVLRTNTAHLRRDMAASKMGHPAI
jgi:hypothetical protein